jgi:hypothetical protein
MPRWVMKRTSEGRKKVSFLFRLALDAVRVGSE